MRVKNGADNVRLFQDIREALLVVDTTMKAWSCSSCGAHVEPPFAVCYNCGTRETDIPLAAFVLVTPRLGGV